MHAAFSWVQLIKLRVIKIPLHHFIRIFTIILSQAIDKYDLFRVLYHLSNLHIDDKFRDGSSHPNK